MRHINGLGAKHFSGGKKAFQQIMLQQLDFHRKIKKEPDLNHTPHTKLTQKGSWV